MFAIMEKNAHKINIKTLELNIKSFNAQFELR